MQYDDEVILGSNRERENASRLIKERKSTNNRSNSNSVKSKPRFICDGCQKVYMLERYLLTHQENGCVGQKGKPQCPYCDTKFTLKTNLTRHIKNKHGEML